MPFIEEGALYLAGIVPAEEHSAFCIFTEITATCECLLQTKNRKMKYEKAVSCCQDSNFRL